jgi:DNA-directed RNA polymerase sigma subunit (sigma70/sigma32)
MHDTRDLQYAAILELLNADPSRSYTAQETANFLGIPRQTVDLIERRALEKLRKRMNKSDWLY